jgi:integrase
MVLSTLSGLPFLMANLLSGAGLRLMECVRLRVKDLDFAYHQITVRDGKGGQDRVTMLPCSLAEPLQRHLAKVKLLHAEDLLAGYGEVYLPYAFARKDAHAGKAWNWPYVFPAVKRSLDPRSGIERRRHVSETVLQKAVKEAIRRADIQKRGSCIRCATVLRRIFLRTATISVRYRSCSAIKMSVPPWSIHRYSSAAAKRYAAL